MLTSEMIKQAALAAGADMCGIGSMDRFGEGCPDDMNPKFLFPEAKSVIGFVFRIPRGVQRGIEEGTQFYQYPSMAYGGINEIFAPSVLYTVGKMIENNGYEAMVYRNTGARGSVSDMDGAPVTRYPLRSRLRLTSVSPAKRDITEVYSSHALQEMKTWRPIYSSISVWQPLLAVLVKWVGAKCS